MDFTFLGKIEQFGKTATGIQVPPEAFNALGGGKRIKVKVTINHYTYQNSIAPYNGLLLLSLSAEHREAAGVKAGEEIPIRLELDEAPRLVIIPADLLSELNKHPDAVRQFEALSYTNQKDAVRQVEESKKPETRERRIQSIVEKLTSTPGAG